MNLNGFFIDTAASDVEYLFIDVNGFTVAIKREAEGIVVDLYPLRAYLEIYALTRQFPPDSRRPRAGGRTGSTKEALAEKNRRPARVSRPRLSQTADRDGRIGRPDLAARSRSSFSWME
jgi:hypothetical protein